jgi:hypothetical protein
MTEKAAPSKIGVNAAFMMEIKDDHRHLHDRLCCLRKLIKNPSIAQGHFRDFVDQLFGLCDQLAFHFALEEAYGYFDDALEATPHLHDQSTKLRNQHSSLFVTARDLADQAAACVKPSLSQVSSLVNGFRAFDVALKVHESAEKGLIMAAVNQDVGVGD